MDYAAARIIDANLNRAREALRVMEEYARFHLDDRSLTAAIKEVRHELAQVGSDLEAGYAVEDRGDSAPAKARGSLIAHRDIVGDVGRAITTPQEGARSDAPQVALAAGKRLGEALRAIEEYGKIMDPSLAARVEQLRYRGYELERRLHLTARARERFGRTRLYVLITESLCRDDWFATAEAALEGGADCLQLREKNLPDRELLGRAQRLAGLCREHGALFIV
ncbi:MAG: thiamine phosphate synthase, partial [Planctomycetes bacterium]|nr:thiamine phosphate synthase [Planctomycetota bacterium]